MTAYRDSFERCPRCSVELRDAQAARGCPGCGGLFLEEAVLTEMIQQMLPPGPLIRLALAQLADGGEPIGCPSCGVKMEPTKLLDVPIERCAKHGVWFDRDELARALYLASVAPAHFGEAAIASTHSTVPTAPVVFKPLTIVEDPLPIERPAQAQAQAPAPTSAPRAALAYDTIGERPTLAFYMGDRGPEPVVDLHILEPDGRRSWFQLSYPMITLGRSSGAVLLPHSSVSATHAGLALDRGVVEVRDLASGSGTFVNGVKIEKHTLRPGDEIQIGIYRLRVGKPFPVDPEALFEEYVAAVLVDHVRDPLLMRVNERLGDPEFHTFVKMSIIALKMDGKRFMLSSHAGLRDAIIELAR